MAGQPVIELVVVQPTPFCNIDCKYCYLPSRSDKSVIADATLEKLFERVFESGWCAPEITVIWHAGEPLVMPVAFYERAFDLIERMRPPGQVVSHSFQTNGMLISPEWCDLFIRRGVRVGVSLDGPQAIHDARRVTRAGQGTFERTMRGIRLLRARGVPFHVISVLSRATMAMPEALHDFYVGEGIDQVCFNIEETEGAYRSDMLAPADAQQEFSAFLARFWQVARARGAIRFIREIEGMIPKIMRPSEMPLRNIQTSPFAILNVDHAGNVSTFSPELLGYRNAEYADFLIGNVHRESLAVMAESPVLASMQRDIEAGVASCAAECGYFSVCGGGAPANKLAENGSFASTRTGYCALAEMAVADLVLDALDRAEARLAPVPEPVGI
jgi:uncharacterized protein